MFGFALISVWFRKWCSKPEILRWSFRGLQGWNWSQFHIMTESSSKQLAWLARVQEYPPAKANQWPIAWLLFDSYADINVKMAIHGEPQTEIKCFWCHFNNAVSYNRLLLLCMDRVCVRGPVWRIQGSPLATWNIIFWTMFSCLYKCMKTRIII